MLRTTPILRRTLVAVVLLAAAGRAAAHDTWFAPLAPVQRGSVRLALGTGNAFPVHEGTVGAASLVAQGCRRGQSRAAKMRILEDTERALHLGALLPLTRTVPSGAITCWAQQRTFELELQADKIGLYLDEINASAALRETWREMQSRGLPWRERYTKNARIELFDGPGLGVAALPAPIGLDLLREGELEPLAVGETITARVLRDGQPLPGLPLQLVHERAPGGVWLRSDGEGRVSARLPLAGRWILRGVDLRLADDDRERWDSRFVTLTFEVMQSPAPR